MDELNWSGLLYAPPPPIALRADDTALLWDGATPLIFLRTEQGGGETLIFNFDPRSSNATRLPAFVLLVNRFVEDERQKKPAPEHANFLAGQAVRLVLPPKVRTAHLEVSDPNAQENSTPAVSTLTPADAAQLHAPSPPAFFTVKVDDQVWLDAAAQFPDPRESDFHDATTIRLETRAQVAREEAHSHPDTLTPLWLLALLGTLLASWREAGRT
jgi:hypothetical protein